ncbi:DUF2059 domain-containing protein [Devosia sp. 67-54]|uniref:DUF2059 domain-containing protein n=2 Tax=unclassified Devosia TaxID=196773 RepID=UPI001AC40938|nr:DUF2059 domain-containing protein [Devosia sp. 67-54]MBN9305716.1 DUF2059 domain-containing protein [Devosia sp.]
MTMYLSRLTKWAAMAVLAVALACGAAAPALSQEIAPETLALARKYVDLTNKAQLYQAILAQTAAQTSKLLTQQNPDLSDKIDAAIGKILDQYKDKSGDLYDQFARVYATTFTPDELKQMNDFYSSPVGVKLASSALDINNGIKQVMQVFTYNFGTEFVTKVRAELKAQGYKF